MRNVYTVAQVNSYIKNMFTQDFMLQSIFVRGEVSNCKYHSSGHIYFTLKDEKGMIACVMFAGNRGGLTFRMEEGQQIVAGGTINVYERDGKYQMYAEQIVLDGAGVLNERYERLKNELLERGMFSDAYKQPIPKYIRTLGVVTAPTGAAVRDIINIATRRNPYIRIILFPAVVQGDAAASSIVQGIRALEMRKVDAMIVGRGGGSLEDLWAFNEEEVAQAVFDCSIPIISAVGHETDTTICDFVADLRAPTPSAAAELAVFDMGALDKQLGEYASAMNGAMEYHLERKRTALQKLKMQLGYLSPINQIREKRTFALKLEEGIQDAMERLLTKKRHEMELYVEKLKGLSPLDKLKQGFSHTSNEEGRTITKVSQVAPGDRISIYVSDGKVNAVVETTEKRESKKRKFQ